MAKYRLVLDCRFLGQTLRYHAQMVSSCVNARADFESDQILSPHGDVHTIAMALIPNTLKQRYWCTHVIINRQ